MQIMIAITCLISVLSCCTTGNNVAATTVATDTLLLYKKDSIFTTGITATQAILHFPGQKPPDIAQNGKVLLRLDNPQMINAPEGVYEIYLTNSLNKTDQLTSSQQSFVALLDLYSHTAPGAKQLIEIDITRQVKNLYSTGEPVTSLFVVLKFAPVKLPDGSFSVLAGTVQFSGITVFQVKD
jgi:hypothetical protein